MMLSWYSMVIISDTQLNKLCRTIESNHVNKWKIQPVIYYGIKYCAFSSSSWGTFYFLLYIYYQCAYFVVIKNGWFDYFVQNLS